MKLMSESTVKTEVAEKSRGELIFEDMNERIKGTFLKLLELTSPKEGEKLDPSVQGLLVEVNVKLREAMYRVVDISNLVNRQDQLGERIAPKS